MPELEGTFLELETQSDITELAAALDTIRHVLHEFGIQDTDLTTETYTGAVIRQRNVDTHMS